MTKAKPRNIEHVIMRCPHCDGAYCPHVLCEGIDLELRGWDCLYCGGPLLRECEPEEAA